MTSGIPRDSFNHLRYIFRNKISIGSQFILFRRMGTLSGVKANMYDCCPNSCVAYNDQYLHYQSCPFCGEARFQSNGTPRRQYAYFPLIPRLQGFFQCRDFIDKMSYRASYQSKDGEIRDVFDGQHYQRLMRHRVVVDGVKLNHKYFADPRDIAFALCTDAYLLYKRHRRGPSATPILLQNYNLPPTIRTHLKHLLCISIIPGPHQPKDLRSFLAPLDDECAELAYGVSAFDARTRASFQLHAYIVLKLGDIIAIEKFLGIKGHNAIYPCRSCKIRGIRGPGTNYYVPLTPPSNYTRDEAP